MSIFKKILSVVAFAAFFACFGDDLPKADFSWAKGPDSSWQLQYEDALAEAKKTRKNILVLRTGSDWCGYCVKLKKNVFSKSEFKNYAKKHLILVWLDFPNRISQPKNQKIHNSKVAQQLRFGRGVPEVIILSPDGKEITRQVGYKPLPQYMEFLKKAASAYPR